MLTVEKDSEAQQIFIHGSPEKLRWLASRLVTIANTAEKSGRSHDHFMTAEWGGGELTSKLQGGQESAGGLISHLIIYGWGSNAKDKNN